MKFRHSYSVHVHSSKASKSCSLSLMISVNSVRKEVKLNIRVPVGAYNKVTRTIVPVPGYNMAPMDNLELQQHLSRLEKIFLQYELSPDTPTIDDVLSAFSGTQTDKPQQHKFMDVLDKFVANQSVVKSWSESTLKKFRTLKSRVKDYQPNVLMSSVNDDWLVSYMAYLSKGYDKVLKDGTVKHDFYRNSSLAKMLKNIRWFLRWAKKEGYYTGNSENFTMEFKGGSESLDDIVYLTSEELHQLRDHQWQHGQQHLERVVDIFIFACYCGLRYSDIATLRRYHIHDGQIHTTIDKTEIKIAIPLNAGTRAILEKYSTYKDPLDRPFPVCSNQRANDYLKDAARLCGITSTVNEVYYVGNNRIEIPRQKCDVLSFHCARRTFITQALILGIPDSVLIQLTGHTTTKMLKRYQGIVDDLKQKQISKFDNI